MESDFARNLDRLDFTLLREVASNARASHVELGKAIGLSATACARRLAALEEDDFIEGYHAALGLRALGLSTTVIVRITLESQSEDALKAFETAVMKCLSVVRFVDVRLRRLSFNYRCPRHRRLRENPHDTTLAAT